MSLGIIISFFYFTTRVLGCILMMATKLLHSRFMDGCSASGNTNPTQTSAPTQSTHLELDAPNNNATPNIQTSSITTRDYGFDGWGLVRDKHQHYATPARVSQGTRTYPALSAHACRIMSHDSQREGEIVRDKYGYMYYLSGAGRTPRSGTKSYRCRANGNTCASRILVYACGKVIMCDSGAFAHNHSRRPNGGWFVSGVKRTPQYG